MSPRAAWRLESIGFTRVYDYVAGKADWGSFGLPLEGQRDSGTRVGAHLQTDVPTCTLEESLRDVCERVRAAGADTCFVVNEQRIVLGRLGRAALARGDDATVEEAMTAGPSTVRPSLDLAAAIERICAWLDTWRQESDHGPWWPQWITRGELHTRRPTQPGPLRPSWCYGTPGLARAQQLAGIATGDTARQRMAEHALAACLSDPAQLSRITDTSLCHGWAGLFQTAWRAARDARTPAISNGIPHLADQLIARGCPGSGDGFGFLEGDAGLALTLHADQLNDVGGAAFAARSALHCDGDCGRTIMVSPGNSGSPGLPSAW